MPVTLRLAVPGDAPGIARVHVDSWRTTYSGIVSPAFLERLSVERRMQMWQSILATPDPRSLIYIAEENGQIVGFINGMAERENDPVYTAEVGGIYLLKSAQGQGTGRSLMQLAARDFLKQGHQAMLLWVLKDNLPARKFYQALGGNYLREKSLQIGEQTLLEVAYGWNDLRTLAKE